jgi:hypothetical protein
MKIGNSKRTLERAVDLVSGLIITAQDLLDFNNLTDNIRYNEIRRNGLKTRKLQQPRYSCDECGCSVYAPYDVNKNPYWKHYPDKMHADCPWYTGKSLSPDAINALKFGGRQESTLHLIIKQWVEEFAILDPLIDNESIQVEKTIVVDGNRRKPDVKFNFNKLPVAVEVQLSTTMLPTIVGREQFYGDNKFRLIWLTWNFRKSSFELIKASFRDIFYSHRQNLFSMDSETIKLSKEKNKFLLKVFWYKEDLWHEKIVSFEEIKWTSNGLAFFENPEPRWHEIFQEKWLSLIVRDGGIPYLNQRILLEEVALRINAIDKSGKCLLENHLGSLISLAFSLREGMPIDTNEPNLTARLNTYLQPKERRKTASFVRNLIFWADRSELLKVNSVENKFNLSQQSAQLPYENDVWRSIVEIFPDIKKVTHLSH